MAKDTRIVGDRGQVTLPKEIRERFGIQGGDEVIVREDDSGRIIVEKAVTQEDLAEGYRARSEQLSALASELDGVSAEANTALGNVPKWES
jgi:AbrB family looped-hinge helix DNA binding protein